MTMTATATQSMPISLNFHEGMQCVLAGGGRNLRAIGKSRCEPYGHPSQRGSWDVQIEGVGYEMAVAKLKKLYWGDSSKLDYDGDVGPYQVRGSDVANGRLPLYRGDADHQYFIFVTGRIPDFLVHGYILAADGKRDEFWEPKRADGSRLFRVPCWGVPQSALHPIDELP